MTETRILFVHGALGDARTWTPVISALPGDWRAEAITLSYFGTEPWVDDGERFGTDLHASEVVAKARDMGGAVHLICWSYGVHVGLKALLDAPGLFASGYLYEAALPGYITDEAMLERFMPDWLDNFKPVKQAVAQGGVEAGARALLGPLFDMVSPDRRQIFLDNAPMMKPLMDVPNPPTPIGPVELATIDVPVCVGMGDMTRDCYALPSRALAAKLGKGELEIIAGQNHFMPELKPAEFADHIVTWVERHTAR